MNKEILQNKIADLLSIKPEDKVISFNIFKRKILDKLSVGEAIKVPDIGIFQLKEQLKYSDSSDSPDRLKGLALVYSPEDNSSEQDFLFLNLDVEERLKDDDSFDENVFQIGIDKTLVTSDERNDSATNDYDIELHRKIDAILDKSEKLDNFDLWDNYLKDKESTTLVDETTEIEYPEGEKISPVTESFNEDEKTTVDELLGTPSKDNDVFDDLLDEENLSIEEETISSSDEQNNTKIEDFVLDEENENLEEKMDNAINEVHGDDLNIEKTIEQKNIESDDVLEEYESYDEIEADMDEEIDNPEELNLNDNDFKLNKEESIVDFGENIEDEILAEEEEIQNKQTESKGKSKLWLFLLLGLFIIAILGGAFYYFFLMKDKPIPSFNAKKAKTTITDNKSENKTTDIVENSKLKSKSAKEKISENKQTESKKNTIAEKNEQKTNDATSINAENKNKLTKAKETNNNVKAKTEREIGNNIYFNGQTYSIQVSSWKNEKIAKKEVARLKRRGYPAFTVKVFIKKFGATWNRVRVGPYKSLNKAKIVQKKIK
ncbi:MAG: hypothetical protein CR986_04500 [Ignavibacteriae bacterium]|nr:MAG: hypothetical protein CR986_04500 [Ignavibacteriota bacterium]